jgi:chromosome segregation ATPase
VATWFSIQHRDRLQEAKNRLATIEEEFEEVRNQARQLKERFYAIKQERYCYLNHRVAFGISRTQRYKKFFGAFSKISDAIDPIYKELTQTKTFPLGGTAYLSLDNGEVKSQLPQRHHLICVVLRRSLILKESSIMQCPPWKDFETWNNLAVERKQWRLWPCYLLFTGIDKSGFFFNSRWNNVG